MSAEFQKELGTKSFDEIVEYTLQSIIQKDIGLSNVNEGSVLRTIVEVLAENEDTMNYYIELIYRLMNINNCTGEDIDRLAKIFGMVRETARAAVGTLTLFTGDEPAKHDVEIPSGFIVSTKPNKNGEVTEFYIDGESIVLRAGESSIDVTIVCTEPGQIYIPAGAICSLSRSLEGIHSISNRNAINGGKDIESDEDFIERIHNIRETLGKCTNESLESAVSQVLGVSNVKVIDMYNGVATTGIMVTTDTTPPPLSVVKDVEEVVNATKASGIKPFIIYTDIMDIDVELEITNISEDYYNTIVDAINKYCNSLNTGQDFIIKQMERKILNAIDNTAADNDDVDIETLRPISNVSSTNEQIIRLGSVTINGITI